jgi:hypothetical protein
LLSFDLFCADSGEQWNFALVFCGRSAGRDVFVQKNVGDIVCKIYFPTRLQITTYSGKTFESFFPTAKPGMQTYEPKEEKVCKQA